MKRNDAQTSLVEPLSFFESPISIELYSTSPMMLAILRVHGYPFPPGVFGFERFQPVTSSRGAHQSSQKLVRASMKNLIAFQEHHGTINEEYTTFPHSHEIRAVIIGGCVIGGRSRSSQEDSRLCSQGTIVEDHRPGITREELRE
jgi:hypothetical protein